MVLKKTQKGHATATDEFMAAVPTGSHRCVVVYLRTYQGKQYVRWRVWHLHKQINRWYPDTRRCGTVKREYAKALGGAIALAGDGKESHSMPQWLSNIEERRDEKIAILEELGAPEYVLEPMKISRRRAYAESGNSRPRRKLDECQT